MRLEETIPAAIAIAGEMQSACPNAWLLNFTNPSGIVTEALLKHTHTKVFGLCSVPISIKMGIAKALGFPTRGSALTCPVGLNHLSFVTGLCLDGESIMDRDGIAFARRIPGQDQGR